LPIQEIGLTADGCAWLVSYGLHVSDDTLSIWTEVVAGLVLSATLAGDRLVALTHDGALHVGTGEAYERHGVAGAEALALRAIRPLGDGLLLSAERDLYWTAIDGAQLRRVPVPLSHDVRPIT